MQFLQKVRIPVNKDTEIFSDLSENGKDFEINLFKDKYENGNTALIAYTDIGEPFGKVSVNFPESLLSENEIFVKTYSENSGWVHELIKQEVIVPKGKNALRLDKVQFPLCEINV